MLNIKDRKIIFMHRGRMCIALISSLPGPIYALLFYGVIV